MPRAVLIDSEINLQHLWHEQKITYYLENAIFNYQRIKLKIYHTDYIATMYGTNRI